MTAERLNGKPVYAKEGEADRWLFFRKDGKWCAGASSKDLEQNTASAGFATSEAGLAHPAAAKAWKLSAQPIEISIMVRSR